ncbi:TorD/DmsD family molecular chaperone [Azospirillum halopraeferens]|uniref:TorD/DmsD family molecular chaperone n=1 Tax=Azospirillum halopraeferens TaxID=34010 RepID=UPI0004193B2A|nr:molecular chaperone TorD family protein [Azospirillum halopraeferens]
MSYRSFPAPVLADVYGELAGYFGAALDYDDVHTLRLNGAFGPLQALAADPRYAPDLRCALDAVLAPVSDDEATVLLNRGYCQLFLGIGGAAGAPPFESAYRGAGRLFQEPVGAMAALLAACGLQTADGFVEPPDHIAVELSLLARLTRDGAAGADAPDAAALRERMAEWVPAFARGCARYDRSLFYAPLAAVLATLLDDGARALAA